MEKILFILLFISSLYCTLDAQNEQIAVSPFTWETREVSEAEAARWYGDFLSEIMNVSPVPVLSWEGEAIKPGDVLGLERGARLGATHVITGHVLSIDNSSGVPNPQIHVCVYDVNTKLLEYSSIVSKSSVKQFESASTQNNGQDSGGTPLTNADGKITLKGLASTINAVDISRGDALQIQIRKFMNESFPPQIPLMGVEETKGDRAISVKFTGPISLFNTGQALEIIQWIKDGGVDRRLTLASGRVSAIQGQVIIVKLGGSKEEQRNVLQKINEAGIYITTKS